MIPSLPCANFLVADTPSYMGALDVAAVRERLKKIQLPLPIACCLHECIWKADVSSVASLRWLLPVAEKLRNLVSSEQ